MEKTIEIPEGYKARIEGDKVILEKNESEDERIRKTLLRCCDDWDKGQYGTMAKKDVAKIRAYLEKQKGQKPAEWKPQPESLEALMYAIEGKWSTIPPTSYLSRRLEDLYEGLVNTFNVDEKYLNRLSETEYTEKDKDAIKPTPKQDYSGLTDLERAIHRGFLCAGVENVPVGIIKDAAQDCLAQIKPGEWSKEDSRMLCDIVGYITEAGSSSGITKQERVDFLYGLPKRFNLQPTQEWSEEDKEKLERVDDLLWRLDSYIGDDCSISDQAAEELREEIKNVLRPFLKSIRPQPNTVSIKNATKFGNLEYERGVKDGIQNEKNRHWKPSEEQMEQLRSAAVLPEFGPMVTTKKQFPDLESLYNDLKKL